MNKFPVLSGREIIAVLKRLGFENVGQKGSHIKMRKIFGGRKITTIIPSHKTVMTGTLKGILGLAEVKLEDFLENL